MADSEPAKPRDIAVFWSRRDSHCDGCDADLGRGSAIRLDGDKAFCLACADMEHLVPAQRRYRPHPAELASTRASRPWSLQ